MTREPEHRLPPDPKPASGAAIRWAEIVERRAREVLERNAELVDGKTALDRVRARLKDRR